MRVKLTNTVRGTDMTEDTVGGGHCQRHKASYDGIVVCGERMLKTEQNRTDRNVLVVKARHTSV